MLRKFESGSAVSRWLYPTQSNSFKVYIEYVYIYDIEYYFYCIVLTKISWRQVYDDARFDL